jgi:hypothetical protein
MHDRNEIFRPPSDAGKFIFEGKRAFPPLGIICTVVIENGQIRGEHEDRSHFIRDRDVQKIFASHQNWSPALDSDATPYILGKKNVGPSYLEINSSKIPIFASENSRGETVHLIPQMAQRSCFYACGAMLLLDFCSKHGIDRLANFDIFERIYSGSLCNDSSLIDSLNRALNNTNYIAALTIDGTFTEAKLERKLNFGTSTIGVSSSIGGHQIILDSIFTENGRNFARIRDPYHGWDITIKRSYLKALTGDNLQMIQIRKKNNI